MWTAGSPVSGHPMESSPAKPCRAVGHNLPKKNQKNSPSLHHLETSMRTASGLSKSASSPQNRTKSKTAQSMSMMAWHARRNHGASCMDETRVNKHHYTPRQTPRPATGRSSRITARGRHTARSHSFHDPSAQRHPETLDLCSMPMPRCAGAAARSHPVVRRTPGTEFTVSIQNRRARRQNRRGIRAKTVPKRRV